MTMYFKRAMIPLLAAAALAAGLDAQAADPNKLESIDVQSLSGQRGAVHEDGRADRWPWPSTKRTWSCP